MNARSFVWVVAALALLGSLWLMGADQWFGLKSGDAPATQDPNYSGTADSRTGTAGEGANDSANAPVLFGRPAAARVGPGSLGGRIMDFDAGKPVADARLLLSGTSHDGAAIAARAESDAQGRFRIVGVAAGEDYTLSVQAEALPVRLLEGTYVVAGGEIDLGDIFLGGKAVLEGRVINADGRGVADARVLLYPGVGSLQEMLRNFGELFASLDRESRPLAEGKTGSDGRFRIEAVEPGVLTVLVRAAGYAQGMVKATMTPAGVAGEAFVITLDGAEPVRGVVVDDSGRGVGGARVAMFDKDDIPSVLYGRVFTESDSTGAFTIQAPPPGESYAVIAAAEGHLTSLGEVSAGTKSVRLVLSGGAQLTISLHQREGGEPVSDAAITVLYGEAGPEVGMSTASGVSDARGEVRLRARPGQIQMVHIGHSTLGGGIYSPEMGRMMGTDGSVQGPKEFEIKPGSNQLSLTLGQGVLVVGKVSDASGQPLAGARCWILHMMGSGGEATSNAEGYYEIRTGTQANFVLASLPGYVQHMDPAKMGQGGQRDDNGRIVFDVEMKAAAAVAGRVVDGQGRPLAGVEVRAAHGEMAWLSMFGSGARTTTNAAGRYLLDGVMPSPDVKVVGSRTGYVTAPTPAFAVQADGVTSAPDLKLTQGAGVLVRVVDLQGAAARGARVQVHVQRADAFEDTEDLMRGGMSAVIDRTTGSDGQVRIEALPPGTITLTATTPGTAGARVVLVLGDDSAGSVPEVLLALRPASAFRGRVLDPQGKPLVDASVQVSGVGGDDMSGEQVAPAGPVLNWVPRRRVKTDAEGRFEFTELPEGEFLVSVTHKGHRTLSMRWVGDRQAAEVRLEAVAAADAGRLEQITAELMAIYQALQAAKDEEERSALMADLQRLTQERAELMGDGGGAVDGD